MKEKIFIAWSGNCNYAINLSNSLRRHGYDAIVGGNVSSSSEKIFVGETIITQMTQCSQAIMLIQKKPDTGMISANLMFEFGFLLEKLNYDKIHVFFIDIDENDIKIPSDIRGIWADYLCSNEDQNDIVETIVNTFLKRQYSAITDDKINIIVDWYYYKNLIKSYYTEPKCTSFELAQYLLFYMQAVYFNKDNDETKQILNKLLESYHTYDIELQCSLSFCKITLGFYDVFYSPTNNVLTKEIMTRIYNNYCDLEEKIFTLKESEYKCWFHAIIYEHLGFLLYYYLLGSNDPLDTKVKYYNQVIKYNELALSYLDNLTNGNYASNNNLFFATLYKAYIYRQKAVSHNFIRTNSNLTNKENEMANEKNCFIKAFEMRRKLNFDFNNIRINSVVLDNMELDYYLSMSEILCLDNFASQKNRYINELNAYLEKQRNKCDVASQHIKMLENNLSNGDN